MFHSKSIKLLKFVMFTKIAPQFRKVLYKWTPQEAKLLHGLKNLFQALLHVDTLDFVVGYTQVIDQST
jgi:hypothetical protein